MRYAFWGDESSLRNTHIFPDHFWADVVGIFAPSKIECAFLRLARPLKWTFGCFELVRGCWYRNGGPTPEWTSARFRVNLVAPWFASSLLRAGTAEGLSHGKQQLEKLKFDSFDVLKHLAPNLENQLSEI